MLIHVYPLRMVLSGGLASMTGGWVPSEMRVVEIADLEDGFVVCGVGFTVLAS